MDIMKCSNTLLKTLKTLLNGLKELQWINALLVILNGGIKMNLELLKDLSTEVIYLEEECWIEDEEDE